jgi:hypothetical protein
MALRILFEELDGPAVSALRRAIAEVKQPWSVIGWVTKNLLSRAPQCFGRHVKPLIPTAFAVDSTNPHWARVMGYGPFSLCVIPKEGLCPSSGDINRLMMKDTFLSPAYLTSCLASWKSPGARCPGHARTPGQDSWTAGRASALPRAPLHPPQSTCTTHDRLNLVSRVVSATEQKNIIFPFLVLGGPNSQLK